MDHVQCIAAVCLVKSDQLKICSKYFLRMKAFGPRKIPVNTKPQKVFWMFRPYNECPLDDILGGSHRPPTVMIYHHIRDPHYLKIHIVKPLTASWDWDTNLYWSCYPRLLPPPIFPNKFCDKTVQETHRISTCHTKASLSKPWTLDLTSLCLGKNESMIWIDMDPWFQWHPLDRIGASGMLARVPKHVSAIILVVTSKLASWGPGG